MEDQLILFLCFVMCDRIKIFGGYIDRDRRKQMNADYQSTQNFYHRSINSIVAVIGLVSQLQKFIGLRYNET